MSRFFIERPIFAIVIAVLIMLGGGLAIVALPIEQLPPIAPPTVQVSASSPGASASTALTATPPPGGCRQRSRHISRIEIPRAAAATHSCGPKP